MLHKNRVTFRFSRYFSDQSFDQNYEMSKKSNLFQEVGGSILIEPFFSSHFWELYDLAGPVCGLVRVCCFGSESLAEPCDSVLTDALLHMEIMLSHIHTGVTNDALDSSEANALLFHKILGPLTHLLVNDPTGTCIIPIMQKILFRYACYYSDRRL